MKSPGVDVRPIRQISGLKDFNETFLTDMRVPDADRIGAVGEGWACAMTLLTGERLDQGGEGNDRSIADLIRYAGEIPRRGGTALDSSAVRLALASAYAEEQAERHFQARLRTRVSRGENPRAAASIVKLAYANRYRKTSGLAMELREMSGLAVSADDTFTPELWHDYIWSTALRIAGGADEVLRNQISERVLGMPGRCAPTRTCRSTNSEAASRSSRTRRVSSCWAGLAFSWSGIVIPSTVSFRNVAEAHAFAAFGVRGKANGWSCSAGAAKDCAPANGGAEAPARRCCGRAPCCRPSSLAV